MRVVQESIYDNTAYRLDNLTEALQNANEVVTTGKRINQISDDPVGLSQTLNLQSNLDQLAQFGRNISTGQAWLNAGETATSNMETMLVNTKTLALSMANGSMNATDRANAAVQVDETIKEMYGIANSQVNGMYLFSGTKGDVQPFQFDNTDTPTQVSYNGNSTGFAIKSGENTTTTVGFSGEDVFGSQTDTIDSTNQNLDFKENGGPELTAVIPAGTYSKSDLAKAVEVAMNTASANGGNGVTYQVSYDADTQKFTIDSGGSVTNLQLLWQTGTHKDTNIGADMGFDVTDESSKSAYTGNNGVQWGIFNTLFNLRDALQNNDTAAISQSLSKLDDAANQITDITSQIGYKGKALDARTSAISDLNLSDNTQKSTIDDADMITAITDLQSKQLAYQAALSSSAQVMKLSLVNYM